MELLLTDLHYVYFSCLYIQLLSLYLNYLLDHLYIIIIDNLKFRVVLFELSALQVVLPSQLVTGVNLTFFHMILRSGTFKSLTFSANEFEEVPLQPILEVSEPSVSEVSIEIQDSF